MLGAPLVLLALVAALAGGLWLWLGSGTSLATVLDRVAPYLPAGHSLQARDVSGSVRQGGHIGSLHYQSPDITIDAQDIAVEWQIQHLLQRKLNLSQLRVAQLRITQAPSTSPSKPLTEVVLPLQLDVVFAVNDLQWTGPPALLASNLAGRYRYDGSQHQLKLDSLHIASGQYSGQAQLQAHSPMALDAKVEGQVETSIPGSKTPLHIAASASAQGPLAGQDAQLEVRAQLTPDKAAQQPLQATVTAQVRPWAEQPLHQAEAKFQDLNLAALWPDAPQTRLSGTAQVMPDASGTPTGSRWNASAAVDNRLSGPWDKNRIPVDSARAQLQFQQGAWVVQSLTAQLGQGSLHLQGHLQNHLDGTASNDWTAQAELQRINPSAIYTQLDPAPLNGQLSAQSRSATISFTAAVQPAGAAPARSALNGLRIQQARAVGRWAQGTLSLSTLQLQTDDAQLQGQLDVALASRATKGQLQLRLPGAKADLQGNISAQQGAGDVSLHVTDALSTTRWLARLPGLATRLQNLAIKGQADLSGHWTGGWANPTGSTQKSGVNGLGLQAQLSVPTLELRPASGEPIVLRNGKLDLSGRLHAMDLQLQAELTTGTQQLKLDSRASADLSASSQWQARIASLVLQLQDSTRPGPWRLQLDQPLALKLTRSAGTTALDAAAGTASLTGPAPGSARISWQPVAWAQDGVHTRLRTQGTVQGITMGWLETLAASSGQLAQLGLKGDLVLDGDWDIQAAQTLQISANLSRRSGDILLQTGDDTSPARAGTASTASTISAGIRTASVGLRSNGNQMRASLRWDSERAGQIEANLGTQINNSDSGWTWPADAPLSGSVRAELPRVGIWSVLAPPGWRMRGTLAANASLSGTRQAPQWTGTLQADDLALRSVVEGIELRDGRFRATLEGQRLNINEFSLRGAPTGGTGAPATNDGGTLTATGFARWSSVAPVGIQLDLQAQAQALRVSARADRRLSVSGKLQAHLEQGKLSLQGAVKADQALFILPDETAPSLGGDVVVRTRSTGATATTAATPTASKNTPDITLDLDLGNDFRLVGRGLDTRLTGQLKLRAGPTLAGPRVTGELRTVRGSYRAYSQNLDIEEGILRFNGPYDNPSLDVLAIRPNLSVRVGVQITGTALAPRVRLYSDSDLSDAEKLAWLVLGRSAANGGAEAAVLQQAALALLGGNGKGISGGLASALGLDELSFSGSGTKTDGTTTAAAVTFGKRLSRDFYVAYEHSLAGTLGTLYIFYDLSKRFTLRGQTGEQSAIDLIFTLTYD